MIKLSGNRLHVRSTLRMAEADAVCRAGLQALPLSASVVIDLSDVSAVDSSALSVLLHWSRALQASGHRMTVESAPAELVSLAHLYGVADTFGLA